MRLKPNRYMKSELHLRPFQSACIWQMINRKSGLIALPTGTGKTITSLSIYTYLKHKFPDLKLLYITDKTLIKQTYNQDLPTYFKDLSASFIYDNNKQERNRIYARWAYQDDILLINYHTLRNDFKDLGQYLKQINCNFITILDEATAFKNTTAQITECVTLLTRVSKRTYALTATPGTSGLYDVFNILSAIQLKPYKSKAEFEQHHCKVENSKIALFRLGSQKRVAIPKPEKENTSAIYFSISNTFKINPPIKIMSYPQVGNFKILNPNNGSFRWAFNNQLRTSTNITALARDKKLFINVSVFDKPEFIGYKNIKGFREQTQKFMFIRSKKEIASELPPVNIIYRYCEETAEVQKTIKKIYATEKYSASQIEIATNTPQAYNTEIPQDYISDKIQHLIYYLQNDIPNEKCIVFYPYTQTTALIKPILESHLDTEIVYVHGQTADRDGELQKFLNSDKHRILIGTQTILKGLNLQAVDNLAILQTPYTFGNYLQLIGRINRIGGNNNTKTVVHFITKGTRDEDIHESALQQGVTIYKLDKRLIDEGVVPKEYLLRASGMTEQQAKLYLEKQLEARKLDYMKR